MVIMGNWLRTKLTRSFLNLSIRVIFLFSLLFFFSEEELLAQEFARQSLTSSEMVRVLNRDERYNLRLGGIKLQIDAALQGEMNDNINLSSSKGALSDLIFRPGVEAKGGWQVTENNKITSTLGMSFAKYVAHPEYDSTMPLIAPNSESDFVMAIGDWRVKLFDRFRMQEDPTTNGQLSSIAAFRRFENDLGILVDWDLNQFILTSGYTWSTFLSIDPTFESLNRDSHTFIFEPKYLVNEAITLGLSNQYTVTDFEKKIQNDSISIRSGPFAEIKLTKYTTTRVEIGYQDYSSDRTGTIQDSSSFSSIYSRFSVKNRLNKYMNHDLSFTRMAEAGIGSNFVDRISVDYGVDWQIVKDTGLRGVVFYENLSSSGGNAEVADRYGLLGRLSYPLTISTMVALEYRFTYKDSNLFEKDYIQNVTSAIVSYSF